MDLIDARRRGGGEECEGLSASTAPYAEFTLTHPRLSIVVMSYFGLALGFLTGLLGIGGGVVLVPALIYLVGMRAHQAAATSLALVALSSFVAVIVHAGVGNTDLGLVVPLLIGGSVGVQFGATLCDRCNGQQLKRPSLWWWSALPSWPANLYPGDAVTHNNHGTARLSARRMRRAMAALSAGPSRPPTR